MHSPFVHFDLEGLCDQSNGAISDGPLLWKCDKITCSCRQRVELHALFCVTTCSRVQTSFNGTVGDHMSKRRQQSAMRDRLLSTLIFLCLKEDCMDTCLDDATLRLFRKQALRRCYPPLSIRPQYSTMRQTWSRRRTYVHLKSSRVHADLRHCKFGVNKGLHVLSWNRNLPCAAAWSCKGYFLAPLQHTFRGATGRVAARSSDWQSPLDRDSISWDTEVSQAENTSKAPPSAETCPSPPLKLNFPWRNLSNVIT